jgi:uncharacterized membrane protein
MSTKQPSLHNLEPNIAAAFAYLIPLIGGVVFFISEKENKFVRFHAFQSILFWLVSWGLITISASLTVVLVGYVLIQIVPAVIFVLWIFLMWKAYNNKMYKLPYLGNIAENQINKK